MFNFFDSKLNNKQLNYSTYLVCMCHNVMTFLHYSALKSTVVEVFTPRRPLKPVRRERKKLEAKNLTLTNVNVIIRVIRAFNVPVREDGMRNLEDMLANVQHDAGSQDISGVRARDNSIIKV